MGLRLRRRTIDINNNNNDESRIQAKLVDGTQTSVGDFVWIRHNQCIDTPAIIHRISTEARIEVTNLFDQKVISLSCMHVTKSCKTLIEMSECSQKYRTRASFQQYEYRKAIESLVDAIESAKDRTKFCTETFKLIVDDAQKRDWCQVWIQLDDFMESNNTHGFEQKCMKFVFELERNPSMMLSNEEIQSIAMKICEDKSNIPFSLPKHKRVCNYCCMPGRLIECTGRCRAHYHQKCIKSNHLKPLSTRIDWHAIEDDCDNEYDGLMQRTRRTTASTSICRACEPSATGRRRSSQSARLNIDANNNRNDRSNCDTCTVDLNGDDHTLTCIKCLKSFHSKFACIPTGALLLSHTQLICCIDNVRRKKSSVCSVCHVAGRRLNNCTACACSFHGNCRPNQTKCQHCTTNHRNDRIVFTYRKQKWWPAIIITNEQLPTDLTKKMCGPGIVSVFIIDENEYEQVYALNLLHADNFAVISALNKYDERGMEKALAIATAIKHST